jgi:hypothetical protein
MGSGVLPEPIILNVGYIRQCNKSWLRPHEVPPPPPRTWPPSGLCQHNDRNLTWLKFQQGNPPLHCAKTSLFMLPAASPLLSVPVVDTWGIT